MTLALTDGRLDVYKTESSASTPDFSITPPDLLSVEVSLEIQESSGKAKISINNTGGRYAGEITPGDKLEFVATIGSTQSASTAYGESQYADGSYGVSPGSKRRWTGLAGIPRYRFRGAGKRTMSVSAYPYAFGIMGTLGRKVDNAFTRTPAGVIARTILEDEAPELDPSGIDTFEDTVIDIEFSGTPLQEAIRRLAARADAVLTARGETVRMVPVDGIPVQWTATARDFTTWDTDGVDDELWNQIRIVGGTANDIGPESYNAGDDAETVADLTDVPAYTHVAERSPAKTQLTLPKSRIDEVTLWTRPRTAETKLTVGIQEDDDGKPVNITDKTADLVSKSIEAGELTEDGLTSFRLEPTDLPARDPWLIVRADDSPGHDIGTDRDGKPIYAAYYPFKILTQRRDRDSIERYLRREHRIERENITSSAAASSVASATLRHHADLEWTFDSSASSLRAHRLRPAQAIRLDFPEEQAIGEYIVTSRTDKYAPSADARNLLQTDLQLQEIESY